MPVALAGSRAAGALTHRSERELGAAPGELPEEWESHLLDLIISLHLLAALSPPPGAGRLKTEFLTCARPCVAWPWLVARGCAAAASVTLRFRNVLSRVILPLQRSSLKQPSCLG